MTIGLEDRRLRGLLPLLLLGLLSCGSSSGPPDLGESLSVLFVGNSLTYTENLPRAGGRPGPGGRARSGPGGFRGKAGLQPGGPLEQR